MNLLTARKISQLVFTTIFVYILWSTTYPLKGYIHPKLLFIFDPFLMITASISGRAYIDGLMIVFLIIGLTLIFGRFFCGWICPMGTVIDLTSKISRLSKFRIKVRPGLRKVKYIILALALLSAIFREQIAWVFDPIVIFGRFISLNFIPFITLAINSSLIFIIKLFGRPQFLIDTYNYLKNSLLGVNPYIFDSSLIIFIQFSIFILLTFITARFWCRYLCPLGAFYAFFSKYSLLKRAVKPCSSCMRCKSRCRMDAINDDLSTVKPECILCMECKYDCPGSNTQFRFGLTPSTKVTPNNTSGISRKNFILLTFFSPLLLAFKSKPTAPVIRPPASLEEEDFKNRCIRCGNCMKVCVTNGLQPVLFESGLNGVWTPQLAMEVGYCEYNCTLCTEVCPTGAIRKVSKEQKHLLKLGTANIDRKICLPWAEGTPCIVCEEHCPTPEKAIKLTQKNGLLLPVVDETICVGCGICQNKCPVTPERAIKVLP